jgi:DNA-binding CsgD family transcriptional regulator
MKGPSVVGAGRREAAPIFERAGELELLSDLAAEAAAGNGGAALVEAAAGLGKTSLLGAAREAAAAAGATVLSALGGELEDDIPFGVVRQLLDPLLADEDLEPGPGSDHRLYFRVAEMSEERPLALIVDDAHWADLASLHWLTYLARRIEGLAILLVVAARPAAGEAARALEVIRAAPATASIELAPLTAAGSALVIADRLGADAAEDLVEACHRSAQGNPFLLSELAGALAREGLPGDARAAARARELAPASVVRAFDARVAALGEEPRALAKALAALGDAASLPLAAAGAGLVREDAIAAYGALAAAGIAVDGEPIGFVHPIARTALYESLGQVERWRLHEAVAAALREAGAPVEQVAHHLLRALPTEDEQAARILAEVGREAAARGALQEAIKLFERALAEPPATAERAGIVVALAEALVLVSRHEEAIAVLDGADLDGVALQATMARARALAGLGDGHAAVALLDEAAAERDGDEALSLQIEATTLGMYVPEFADRGVEMAARFGRLSGDTPTERLALGNAALALGYRADADADKAVAVASRALTGDLTPTDRPADRVSTLMAMHVLVLADEIDAARRAAALYLEPARKDGIPATFLAAVLGQMMIARVVGDVETVLAEGELVWVDAELPDEDLVALRLMAYAGGTLLEALVVRGEVERAREIVAEAERQNRMGRPELAWLHYGRGRLRLQDGDAQGALDDFLAVAETAGFGRYEFRNPAWRLGAARALAMRDDRDAALELVDAELEIARHWGRPGGVGVVLRHRAVIGEEDAVGVLTEAVDLLRASPRRLDLAEALIDLGRARRRAGTRGAAREALKEGMDLASHCGARAVAESARQDLIALGERPRRHRISGVDALTPTERRIADLAASGASNRMIAQELFVTPKTVEGHLSNAYRKLGIETRTQLPEALRGAKEADSERPGS